MDGAGHGGVERRNRRVEVGRGQGGKCRRRPHGSGKEERRNELGFERTVGRIFNLCCVVTRAVDQYD
jgi:hypothetical protein